MATQAEPVSWNRGNSWGLKNTQCDSRRSCPQLCSDTAHSLWCPRAEKQLRRSLLQGKKKEPERWVRAHQLVKMLQFTKQTNKQKPTGVYGTQKFLQRAILETLCFLPLQRAMRWRDYRLHKQEVMRFLDYATLQNHGCVHSFSTDNDKSSPWETCISYEVFALGTSGNGMAKRRWAVI